MSVIKNDYTTGPVFIGTCKYIENSDTVLYGGDLKTLASLAWSIFKPAIRDVLKNKDVRKAVADGANKLADMLDDKKKPSNTTIMGRNRKAKEVNNGAGLSNVGRERLNKLLGHGIKYLY